MPFPFYNVGAPTQLTKNSITNTATSLGLRDFLLNRNLSPRYPQLSTSLNGSPRIGEPVLETSINGNSNVIPIGLPLEVEGLNNYNTAILPNKFKNDDGISPTLLNIDDIQTIQGVFGSVDYPQGTQSYPISATQDVSNFGLLGKTEFAEFRKKITLYNQYLDASKQLDVSDYISLQPVEINRQIKGYLDEYGALNVGDSGSVEAANIIGSILNGQGLGFAKAGIVTNFDIRSSLAGRVLGAVGAINDTKLGMIGAQQLALSLANNAAFNTQQNILGALNVSDNMLSIAKGNGTTGFRPNYKITIPSSTAGQVFDYTASILGFTVPRSYLSDAGSIFTSEYSSGNIERANAMIENTGKGQVVALITNANANLIGTGEYDNPDNTPFRSGYAPGYLNNKGEKAINPNLYAFYNSDKATIYNFIAQPSDPKNVIPEISYQRDKMVSDYGFKSPEETFTGPRGNVGYNNRKISDVGFTWTTGNGDAVNASTEFDELIEGEDLHTKKSLLFKTQKLFNSVGMKSIVSVKGEMGQTSSQIQTANADGISKGSAVLSGSLYNANGVVDKGANAENTFCRSWTTLNRYDTVSKMVRKSGLNATVPYRFQTINSTLDDNGFPKIAPYTTDIQNDPAKGTKTNPKNYMFSIENLAWQDDIADLPPVEIGSGDLTTGKRGRIMWFPPYNIQFSETSSVDWETNKFIGRGEPIYTYNNTERSGNLSFSIIVDHSSYMNSFRGTNGPEDNYVASFVAGCVEPSIAFADKLTVSNESSNGNNLNLFPQKVEIEPEVPPVNFSVYYPNDVYDILTITDLGYENGLQNDFNNGNAIVGTTKIDYSNDGKGTGFGIGLIRGQVTPQKDSDGGPISPETFSTYYDGYNYGLNGSLKVDPNGPVYSGLSDPAFLPALENYLETKGVYCTITIQSYASPQGVKETNDILAQKRTESIYNYLNANLNISNKTNRLKVIKTSKALTGTGCKVDGNSDEQQCKLDRKSDVSFAFSPELAQQDTITPNGVNQAPQQNRRINTKIINKLYDESNYFDKLADTDKFVFDSFREKIKYFHPSFHSMTPEGLNSRLTFLHQCTRQGPTLETLGAKNLAFGRPPICILRIGDFYNTKVIIDNLTIDYEPIVWDLNPEGIGVQPMIANVNLSIKFIGGSSLLGPINKLQNALSFNYYANTHVYDPRADYIAKKTERTGAAAGAAAGAGAGADVNTDLVDWEIVNGVSNVNVPEYRNVTIINTPVEPVTNQILANDVATGPTTPPPANVEPPAQLGSDKDIYLNGNLFARYSLNIDYTDKGDLTGDFYILDNNDLLNSEHVAKLQILSSGIGGAWVDIVSFTIAGPTTPNGIAGKGSFTTSNNNWRQILTDYTNNNKLNFRVIIPEWSMLFFNEFFYLPYDCPAEDYKYGDLLDSYDFENINNNPCLSCYPNPYTATKPVMINGIECPLSGTTT